MRKGRQGPSTEADTRNWDLWKNGQQAKNTSHLPDNYFVHNLDMVRASDFPLDQVSNTLLNNPDKFGAIATSGDGNCFPRSVSTIVYGTQERYSDIRHMLTLELIKNEHIYTDSDKLRKMATFKKCDIYANVLEAMCLNNNFRDEVINGSKNYEDVGLLHFFAATNILRCPLMSVYPLVDNPLVDMNTMNQLIYPHESIGRIIDDPVSIMWTHTNNDSLVNWSPNHFVPLFPSFTQQEQSCIGAQKRLRRDNKRMEALDKIKESATAKGSTAADKDKAGTFAIDLKVDYILYLCTVVLPLILGTLSSIKTFTGNYISCYPIEANVTFDVARQNYANTYCFKTTVYGASLPNGTSRLILAACKDYPTEEQMILSLYPLLFIVQAIFCYLPYALWEIMYGNEIRANLQAIVDSVQLNCDLFRELQKGNSEQTANHLQAQLIEMYNGEWTDKNMIRGYIFVRIVKLFINIIIIAVFLGKYSQHFLTNKLIADSFCCKLQDEIITSCALSAPLLLNIFWSANIIIIIVCSLFSLFELIMSVVSMFRENFFCYKFKTSFLIEYLHLAKEFERAKKFLGYGFHDRWLISELCYVNINSMLATELRSANLAFRKKPEDEIEEPAQEAEQRLLE